MIPEPEVLFNGFLYRAGSFASARTRFQMLVTDLVGVQHPTANEVAGPGGSDWGIDTYVGRLDDSVVVWQSKFFFPWKGEDQQKQVRESFKEVTAKAKAEGFRLEAWTLCVPCILPPLEQKWFDGWAARTRRAHDGMRIEMWNGVELRKRLGQPDASHVYQSYFGDLSPAPAEFQVRHADDLSRLKEALFVRQLEVAGQVETDAARGLFFAAEALVRDVAASGAPSNVEALRELHLELQSLWESHFNDRVPDADDDGKIRGLLRAVLDDAARLDDVEGLRLRPAHRRGIVHRLVEDVRAGWVRHWRDIAESHQGRSARELIVAELQAPAAEEVT